jgi:methylthioribose-1-phosphate isomerase
MIAGHSEPLLSGASYSAAELSAAGDRLFVLDQRLLPVEETYLTYDSVEGAAVSIRDMVVRGAPAIGITAAYGMALAARAARAASAEDYRDRMRQAAQVLNGTRPTAVNLTWATSRCLGLAEAHAGSDGTERTSAMAELAREIHRDDVSSCRAMGAVGARLLPDRGAVLTHCNAGALATGGYGTALGVIRAAVAMGKVTKVFATETRPYLQGARLTAWELHRDGIDVTVITDSMAAHCLDQRGIGAIVVGADRIAANGDVANKIGTYGLACLAHVHRVPFFVAAPWSTIDLATPTGAEIVIEERAPLELTHLGERQLVPAGVGVYNPAFDVTPARLIRAIITENGALAPGDLASVGKSQAPAEMPRPKA